LVPILKTKIYLEKLKSSGAPKDVLELGEKILENKATVFETFKFFYYPADESAVISWVAMDPRRRFDLYNPKPSLLELMLKRDAEYAKIIEDRVDSFDGLFFEIRAPEIYKKLLGLKKS
jgi:hypothetical protein